VRVWLLCSAFLQGREGADPQWRGDLNDLTDKIGGIASPCCWRVISRMLCSLPIKRFHLGLIKFGYTRTAHMHSCSSDAPTKRGPGSPDKRIARQINHWAGGYR
jgi:hypothetical protein